MFRFTLPRDIYCGHGAIDELSLLKGHKKAFIAPVVIPCGQAVSFRRRKKC